MTVNLIKMCRRASDVDLVQVIQEKPIYALRTIAESPFCLKQGSKVWVKHDCYTVYELTEDVTNKNVEEFVKDIQDAEIMLNSIENGGI